MSNCVHPCPCGYYGDTQKACTCAHVVVTKYQKRISGPILDRIDIHIEVPRVDYEKLSGDHLGESSEVIRKRVQAARNIQRAQFSKHDSKHSIFCNADMRVGGDQEILQVAGRRSEPDAGGDESVESIGACLSSHPEIGENNRRFGRE